MIESMTTRSIGQGIFVSGGAFDGIAIRARSVEDVLGLLSEDLSEKVLFTEQASATFFGPILPSLRGVVCTQGGPSAHLAIVSRGLDIPCLMQAQIEIPVESGQHVTIDARGEIFADGAIHA
jgi:phosphohistidine swiveling domain-containing protein